MTISIFHRQDIEVQKFDPIEPGTKRKPKDAGFKWSVLKVGSK